MPAGVTGLRAAKKGNQSKRRFSRVKTSTTLQRERISDVAGAGSICGDDTGKMGGAFLPYHPVRRCGASLLELNGLNAHECASRCRSPNRIASQALRFFSGLHGDSFPFLSLPFTERRVFMRICILIDVVLTSIHMRFMDAQPALSCGRGGTVS